MRGDIDHIEIVPDTIGWKLRLFDADRHRWWFFGIGDVIQFTEEVDRTLGKWLADGPADFHVSEPDPHNRPGVRIVDGQPRYSAEWLGKEDV